MKRAEFQALAGSTLLMDLMNPTLDPDYLPYSFNFTATSASTVLAFKFRDDASWINLDDIDVVQVPEPESLALVLAGLLGLTASRAAKRKGRHAA